MIYDAQLKARNFHTTFKKIKCLREITFYRTYFKYLKKENRKPEVMVSAFFHRDYQICYFHVFCKSLTELHCSDFSHSINILYKVWTHRTWVGSFILNKKVSSCLLWNNLRENAIGTKLQLKGMSLKTGLSLLLLE